jgi:Mg2+/Co2+ transporter CorB
MIKAIIGMIKWKRAMKKFADMQPYSDEWWKAMADSLYFLPEEQRETFLHQITGMGVAF